MEGESGLNPCKNILVCVTQQKNCERLIRRAAKLRDEIKGSLYVLHVAKEGWNFLDNQREGEALDYLFGISKSFSADLHVLKSDNIVKTIYNFAIENEINCIVMGESQHDHKENRFYTQLRESLADVDIQVIS